MKSRKETLKTNNELKIESHINSINKCENRFINLSTKHFKFSKNLIKYYDDIVFDMYDHNYFRHNSNTTSKEIMKAYMYQHDNNRDFLKLISDDRLDKSLIKKFGLEEIITLTMLYDSKKDKFKINNKIEIRDITLTDLNKIELKHYESIYGRSFVLRRNKSFIDLAKKNKKFICYGAYIKDKIVGYCYSYTSGKYTCIDSLLVDDKYRHKYIASTLIKHIIDNNNYVYLHADQNDTPKNMYKKLGFKEIKKTYEYYKKVEI